MKKLITIASAVVAFAAVLYALNERKASNVANHKVDLLSPAKTPTISEKAKRDTLYKERLKHKPALAITPMAMDSVAAKLITLKAERDKAITDKQELALELIAIRAKPEYNRDTMVKLQKDYTSLQKQNKALIEAHKNYIVQAMQQNAAIIDSNADISITPFKKKSRANIFSPQKNYLRITRKEPETLVNGKPYYDFEQTNDELNQILFQIRTNYNFLTGVNQVGLGYELKLNRFGINGAAFINPYHYSQVSPSLGVRYDFYRIRFK